MARRARRGTSWACGVAKKSWAEGRDEPGPEVVNGPEGKGVGLATQGPSWACKKKRGGWFRPKRKIGGLLISAQEKKLGSGEAFFNSILA